MNSIYLDHSATTPLHPHVLESMLPYLQGKFGNPSSIHSYGRQARNALNTARDQMAAMLSCNPNELIFTSGGTESDHVAILGIARTQKHLHKNHIITSTVEHHAVLGACQALEQQGYTVTYVPVDEQGMVSVNEVASAIRPETALISIMYGNNEVGTLQPVQAIGCLAKENGIFFHVDAVQALGHVELNLKALPVDAVSFSAHKMHGPKGIGALYLSERVPLQPLLTGGSQERKRRAGTENLAAIVGFAKALELATENLESYRMYMDELRHSLLHTLNKQLEEYSYVVNGHPIKRLPHILNMSFPGVNSETLLMNLDMQGIAASSGSACSSGSIEVSHVLRAMNLPEAVCNSAVRFSFGMDNTMEEVEQTALKLATIVKRTCNH